MNYTFKKDYIKTKTKQKKIIKNILKEANFFISLRLDDFIQF